MPRFEPAPCPKLQGAEELAKASCGYLVVPENRSQPNGRTIRLMVAKYPARSPEKRPDPVVYLAGGPGDIAPLEINGLIAADFIRDRDIYGGEPARHHVLGAGAYLRGQPTTSPESFSASASIPRRPSAPIWPRRKPATANSPPPAPTLAPTIRPRAPPISPTSARCSALTTWNVYGTSYGSYLAQTLMRDHPEGIRSVVLDSVLPTTYNVAENWQNARDGFDNIFQACAAEPACNAAHPHLEQTFTGLVNKLEAEPLTATVKRPGHRQRHQSRPRRRGTGRLAAQPELCRAHASSCAESHRWARRRPPRRHRRRSPWIGLVGRRHPVRMSLPSATDWPLASAVAKAIRSRRRRISPRPAGKRFRTIRPRYNARASAAGRISTKTAATSGRSPPPRRPCTSPS